MKPYRRRVEVLALDDEGRVFGAYYPDGGGFGGYGGGVDPGETDEAAAVREFLEETGRDVSDVRRLAVPVVRVDWAAGETGLTAEQAERRKRFRGSETVFVTGTLGPRDPAVRKEKDRQGRAAGKPVPLTDAIASLGGGDAGLRKTNAGRRAALELLKTETEAPPLAVLKLAAAYLSRPAFKLLRQLGVDPC